MTKIKILFFSDTHLGFDYPVSGKSKSVRRGFDFFDNFYGILAVAKEESVDLVIHGGDLFYRSKVPVPIVDKTYDALFDLADQGIPMVIVPGNHDRSTLPTSLFLQHKNLYIFREPNVFDFRLNGIALQIAGFPYIKLIGVEIDQILDQLNAKLRQDSLSLLCMHQAFEGATVGPVDYRFRAGQDVLGGSSLRGTYSAVLSGHIHRYQLLSSGLIRGAEPVPFIYPGSIERTSFAERFEEKGYMMLELDSEGIRRMDFRVLPSRPMHILNIEMEPQNIHALAEWIGRETSDLKPNAALLISSPTPLTSKWLSRDLLRKLLPSQMHVELRHRWLSKE